MAKGDLGKLILGHVQTRDVEIAGVKLRVRQLRAPSMLALQQYVPANVEQIDVVALFKEINEKSPSLLPTLIAESCFDPESGEDAFSAEDVAKLPLEYFTKLFVAITQASATPEAEDLKA